VLALSLDVAEASTLRIAWRGPADADFLRLRSHTIALVAGPNRIGLELPAGELQGEVLLTAKDLRAVIHSVEWREFVR
jgi:hypothetical protein